MAIQTLESFRERFPIVRGEQLFLDHCRVAVMSQDVVDAMQHFCQTTAARGVDFEEKAGRYERFRERAARLINASSDEIAFVTNTAHGINLVADRLSWDDGDNIVTANYEYPDNVYPWMYLSKRGVELRRVEPREGRIEVDALAEAIDARTKLVALSFVQFSNGYRLDLQKIGELCRERGCYFLVDAIQGLGALRLDVQHGAVDFLACGAHKWLLGPLGGGLFYCRRELLDELTVTTIGTASMKPGSPLLDYQIAFREGAERFEGGPAKNVPGIYGLDASLGLLLDAGIEEIETQVLNLTAHAIEGLLTRGYDVCSPTASMAERSSIVTFGRNGQDSAELLRHVDERGVMLSASPAGVRVAPHFYNTIDDMERFLAALT